MSFVGEKLRITDHPVTGLPHKNFQISFDFKTSTPFGSLFSIDSPIGKGGHDRHMILKDGELHIRVWPGPLYKASNLKLSNGHWHKLKLVCQKGHPIRTYIDGSP
jgi:hypothetical protein